LLPIVDLPLKYSIPVIIFFAMLSAFSRQIWYMLARYFRATDMDAVILDVFARGRHKESLRDILWGITRLGTGALRLLIASIYLRESVRFVFTLFPGDLLSSRVTMTIIFSIILIPLSTAQSLAAKRIIITTWISVIAFVLCLGLVAYAYMRDIDVSSSRIRMGVLWQGITTAAFAFTSSSTLPLCASLRATVHPVTTTKISKSSSFKRLNAVSATVAVALVLPLVFFSSSRDTNSTLPRRAPAAIFLKPFIASLNATTLLLTIPSILITTPAIPIPTSVRRYTTFPVSKIILSIAVFLASLAPAPIWRVMSDVLLVFALSGTYFLPALVHLTTHYVRRPLSIIISPNAPTPTVDNEHPSHDELLQRKERALQRRQLRKRLVWDIGVGVLLVPVGGGGTVWAVGRVARHW